MLLTLSDFSADIPGAGSVVSLLRELIDGIPVEALAREYKGMYRSVQGSVGPNAPIMQSLGTLSMFLVAPFMCWLALVS